MSLTTKQKSILSLLSDGCFHSGTELAETLKVSRTSIWKHLNCLAELGLHYSAVKGKGYRLDKPLELLDEHKIFAGMANNTRQLAKAILIHEQIDSTNNYLSALSIDNAPSGTICFAEQQTAGKGRRGRNWVSPFGNNIYLSIVWRFHGSPLALSGLSLAVGVAVIRSLSQCFGDRFQLKWPNDIYFQNKKLGGILVEVAGESNGPCTAIVGLGLNSYLPPQKAVGITQDWIDLTQILGYAPSRNSLASELLNHLLPILATYEDTGIKAYLNEWRQYDCLKGQSARLYIGNSVFDGIVQGIDDNGLILLLHNGITQAFASGEVSFRQDTL